MREDGTTEWVFESLEDMSEISSADYKLFWIGLYGTPLLWIGLLVISIIRLKFQVCLFEPLRMCLVCGLVAAACENLFSSLTRLKLIEDRLC